MSIPRTTGWGIGLAAATACISGVSIFVNGLVVKEFGDPVALTGARNLLVGLVLLGILLASGGASEVRALDRRRSGGLLALAVIGGSVPFILFFSGLAAAGGPGAGIIQKTMFIWVAALAMVFLGESLGIAQVVALAALLGGEGVSVRLATTARMALGGVLIVGFLVASGRSGAVAAFSLHQWSIVAVTGLLLLGYVTTWYGALQRAPASLVTSVLVGGALVTGVLSAVRAGTVPAPTVEAGLVLLTVGVGVVIWSAARRGRTVVA